MRVSKTGLLALLGSLALLVSVDPAAAWTCSARSRVALGWGVSPYRSVAADIALRQCALRTPYGLMCRITRCRR